jgi:hypothetical protein
MGYIGNSPALNESVTSAQIADNAIITAKINNDAVTGDKIENSPTIASNLTVTGDLSVTGASPTPDQAADGWRGGLSDASNGGTMDIDSDMIIDYDDYSDGENFLGTAHSESAGAITIGTAGWYLILVAAHKQNDVIDTMDLSIRKNTTEVAGRLYGSGWDEVNYASGGIACAVMELAVNDTVDVYGSGYFYSQDNSFFQMCWWCGIRLCD